MSRGEEHSPASQQEQLRRMRQDWYYEPDGPPPGGAGAWQPLPAEITLVQTLDDWYNCQNVSAQIMALQECCQDNSGNPVCPSCGTSCPSCPSCPEPSGGCPSCPAPSCPSASCPPCESGSGESGSGEPGSGSGESGSGEPGSGSGSGSGSGGCALTNYELVSGDGTLTVADAIGEIGPLCPWAIDGGDGNWYVPAGTYLKVLPVVKSGSASGSGCSTCDNPIYVAVGLYGSGCQCDTCPSCPSGSCPSCPSCPSGGSCPSCPSGSCPSAGSCPSCPSGQSGSGSGSGSSGGSGCGCLPPCPGTGNYVLCCTNGVLSWCNDESFTPPLVP